MNTGLNIGYNFHAYIQNFILMLHCLVFSKQKVMTSKRKKSSIGSEIDGQIARVCLKNFLTYDECEFEPGSGLNVILGPNGTGKSSIVCAICLGLGGAPSLLGRAKDAGDYVKHGCKQAVIEIELNKSDGNMIVKRVITKGKGKEGVRSKWFINGKDSNKDTVIDAVGKMNVQMNNLCQFLPQDKVVEFAKMSQQQLLEATEKAVGPPGMYDDHMALINLRKQYSELQNSKNEKENAKEIIEHRNLQLKRDVDRHKEREKHQDKIETLNKKKPWVEYESARIKFMDAKKDKIRLEKELSEEKKKNEPLEKEINKSKEAVKKFESKAKALNEDGAKTVNMVKSLNDKLEKEQDKIEEVMQEKKRLKEDEKRRESRILKLQKDIAALQADYQKAPDPEELKPTNDELTKQIRELDKTMSQLSKNGQELENECKQTKIQIQSIKNQIRELESSDNQRLETLRKIDKKAYDAVLWLRENKSKFIGTVYEPIMTQINMKDIKDSVYVESFIGFNDMKAFVCQNRQDQHTFSNQTRDVLKLNVAAVCPPSDSKDVYMPENNLDELEQYGFQQYLTDLFDAPKTVMQYLNENYRLYNIPVGNQLTERNSTQVIEKVHGLSQFCTPESMYTIRKSKYKQEKSTSVNSLKRNANLLNVGVDLELKKSLDGELAELQKNYNKYSTEYEKIRKEHEVLKKQQERLRSEKKELIQQMRRRATIDTQIETKKKRLANEEKDVPDIETEERKTAKRISEINKKRISLTKEYKNQIQKCVDIGKEKLLLTIKHVQQRIELENIEQTYRESSETLRSLEEAFARVAQACINLKTSARQLLKRAQESTGGASDGSIPDHLQQIFATLPNTVEEIEALIHEEQARLNCQYESDPQVIKNYERNKKDITALGKEIDELSSQLNDLQEKMDERLKRWLLPLENLISRINEQYCDFFKRMGCAGEVCLLRDPDDDYKKFGVEIKVKFRAENKLKALTSTFQSGGERSVSTMLYLISLQELTKCPFRLVDEINQGMDPNNERRVFELVVETVCKPNTSQYFLITPKLLPDLKYKEGMTILTVLNGHWMLPHNQFNVADVIRKKKRSARGDVMMSQ
ncbi:structural maintenance of chromosomes protein 5-like [Hydractinia symbiolongicarpus]|uniref:structural maintenance of chromosomes protein 5-like n=1 Tax=Hydractinia symbiolongicarpus TaxID=13093 RepID=UPI00255004A2|nr:structural maintenance of chromosomes protein 5-like [Hydractinia symbiolongicarpus]